MAAIYICMFCCSLKPEISSSVGLKPHQTQYVTESIQWSEQGDKWDRHTDHAKDKSVTIGEISFSDAK